MPRIADITLEELLQALQAVADAAKADSCFEELRNKLAAILVEKCKANGVEFSTFTCGFPQPPDTRSSDNERGDDLSTGEVWKPGDDPATANLTEMNQEQVRAWLNAVGDDGEMPSVMTETSIPKNAVPPGPNSIDSQCRSIESSRNRWPHGYHLARHCHSIALGLIEASISAKIASLMWGGSCGQAVAM